MTITAPAPSPTSAVAPHVQLRLLGGFELRIDGAVVDLQPAVKRLTALVALTPCGLSRDFAAFQLWPDKSEARARANLRSTLWRLHQLAGDILHASATHLRLDDSVSLDTRDVLAGADAEDGVPRPFETLMADLLPDWYDEWIDVERERFRQLRLARLEQRAHAALADRDAATAIQLALAALAIDATRESAHRIVVRAHQAEGNEWEAERERSRYLRSQQEVVA
ncbi:hypothetical protein GCM10022237_08070 [Nocardioides ginsengisoli]|uniref:Bacterial transcriptional activator domain-containing protein n=1 Tax=Nocardioides ginsengisoli TaxID=363868 RepID=A0ABW3VZC9_9ACTN